MTVECFIVIKSINKKRLKKKQNNQILRVGQNSSDCGLLLLRNYDERKHQSFGTAGLTGPKRKSIRAGRKFN